MKRLFFATTLGVFSTQVFANGCSEPLRFLPLDPCRVYDSRLDDAPKIPFNAVFEQQVAFRLTSCAIGIHTQTSVKAVLATYTVVSPEASGHLRVWGTNVGHLPYGVTTTFIKDQTMTVTTVTKVTSGFPGIIDTRNGKVYYHAYGQTPGGFHLVIDVAGIYVE